MSWEILLFTELHDGKVSSADPKKLKHHGLLLLLLLYVGFSHDSWVLAIFCTIYKREEIVLQPNDVKGVS